MAFISEEERLKRAAEERRIAAILPSKPRSLEQAENLLPEVLEVLEAYAREQYQRHGYISHTRYAYDFRLDHEQPRVWSMKAQDLEILLRDALPKLFEVPPEQISSLGVENKETEGSGGPFSYDVRVNVKFEPYIN